MNIATLIEGHIERIGVEETTYFEGRAFTNREFLERSNRLANALRGLGIKEDEVVAVTMSNCPEVMESFGGILRIGATVLPILFLLTPEECRFILEDSGAVAVITDYTQEEKVLAATADLDRIRHIIMVGGTESGKALDYEELLAKASPDFKVVDKDPDDLAVIMYTSGTTAEPKGVMLTHRNLLECARSGYEASEFDRAHSSILCLPLAHIYGVGAMNIAQLNEFRGSKGIMVRWFNPEECFRLIEKYRVDFFPGVPAMFALLLNHPDIDRYDLSSLEDTISGAAPLSAELQRGFMEKFNCTMRQLYGLTESTGMGAILRPSHPLLPGTVGKAYPRQEIKIFDMDENELPPGEPGEIVIRGPQVMKGYLNRPEETERALRGGWLHTGDVGYLDEDGFLYITDRVKDLIIKGGENIMPAQIEKVIYQHPSVMEAAAVGVGDEVYGEDIVAYVALKPGAEATGESIMEFCSKRLTTFKRPREIIIIDALPKTSVGKILKRDLKKMYEERAADR